MKVFISHITEEGPIALALKGFIEDRFLGQISVFVSSDVRDLTPGSRWLDTITKALKECDVILLICSRSSLTRPWINFEAGCGWIKGINIIPICHSGQRKDQMPFPFSGLQALQLEDAGFADSLLKSLATHFRIPAPTDRKGGLRKKLEVAKKKIAVSDPSPQIIQSPEERTQLINNDLRTLLESENVHKETVWVSAFLSAFAIGQDDPYPASKKPYLELLLKERELLVELARRGCTIKCIISPANKNYIRHAGIDYAIQRTKQLLGFLASRDRALDHIDWAVSELGTKNLYIIGNISCFEGYKKGIDQGYGLTLRQTSQDVINASVEVYSGFFSDLAASTIAKWITRDDTLRGAHELLHAGVVRCLHESLEFLEQFKKGVEGV
jgi:TIR domain